MNGQRGFTLIELVIVIVVLGILAAVAVPRFVNLSSEARIASLDATLASVRSASNMVHGLALAQGKTSTNDGTETVDVEGNTVALAYGYPDASDLADAVALDTAPTVAGGVATITLATGCTVTYTEPASAGAAPTIVQATGGC